jgi:hypothetical protein
VREGASGRANLLPNQRYVRFLGALFVATFAMFLAQPLTPNFLQNERGISLEVMGQIGSIGSVGNVVFNLALGHGNPRLGFLLGHVLVGVFVVAIWKGTGSAAYALGYFFLGGFRAARMLAFAQIRTLIQQAEMGLAYGVTETLNAFAMLLAPLLAGYMYGAGPALIYPVTLGLLAASFLLSFGFGPRESAAAASVVEPEAQIFHQDAI